MLRLVALRPPLLLLALCVLVGCGDSGPSDEEQIRSALAEFGRATGERDYAALCDRILATAPRVLAQLGYAYPYQPDGNGGPPLLEELRWGAHAGEGGRLSAAEPLFPRLEIDPEDR